MGRRGQGQGGGHAGHGRGRRLQVPGELWLWMVLIGVCRETIDGVDDVTVTRTEARPWVLNAVTEGLEDDDDVFWKSLLV